MKALETFNKLWKHSKKIALFSGINSLIEWDQETFMPPGGAKIRAEQIELLASYSHELLIAPSFQKDLFSCIDRKTGELQVKGLEEWQEASLREWRIQSIKALALPQEFVCEFSRLCAQSIDAWKKARKKNQFSLFIPYLKRIIEMNREKAERFGYEKHPYDALLDEYEPGLTTESLDALFPEVGKQSSRLLCRIQEKKQVEIGFLKESISKEKQLAFGNFLLEAIGHSHENGRLDLSTHPFSSSCHPSDSRLTTRISSDNFFDAISATMHEGGHGLYELGLSSEYFGTPAGESRSLGIHESQSRLWETHIGQSLLFWKAYFPFLQKAYGGKLKTLSLETFYKGINKVQPSMIRVESDEVTYPLHVILRFELEKALINEKLPVEEIPHQWNFLMKSLLGITPKTDSEGCMQDIHWSMGAIGYFPTYLLGTLYAAQIFNAFKRANPRWESRIENGELLFLREWLRENIHKYGKIYPSNVLIEKATGASPSPLPYLDYVTQKYTNIYGL